MRFIFLLPLFFLFSCSVSNIDSFSYVKKDRPYNRIMLIPYMGGSQMESFDEDVYEKEIKSFLTNMSNYQMRQQMNNTFIKNISSPQGTILIPFIDQVSINESFTYDDLLSYMDEKNTQSILFVQVTDYWQETVIIDGNSNTQANASFNGYLFDRSLDKFVWSSHTVVEGVWFSGYRMMNNKAARRVAKDLHRKGYIHRVPDVYEANNQN